jgi:regulatory protein
VSPSSRGRPSGPYLPGDRAGGPRGTSGPGPEAPDDRELGPEADHEAVARTILLDQLTGQARSRAELAQRLAAKGVPETTSTRLLDRFEEVGLVDDGAFARAWVQSRQAGRGLARRALAAELRRKGIDDEDARAALDEVDPDDEVEAARRLVRRKLRTAARLDRVTATRRLTGMLARKGYPAGTCFRVVREELDRARLADAAPADPEVPDDTPADLELADDDAADQT